LLAVAEAAEEWHEAQWQYDSGGDPRHVADMEAKLHQAVELWIVKAGQS
jgi:hypothetical protein